MEQIIKFKHGLVCSVRKSFIHAAGVKVPDGSPAHNVQAEWAKNDEIDGCVGLLHESRLLCSTFKATPLRKWPEKVLHYKLAAEGEDDGVEGNEREVPRALAILVRCICGGPGCVWDLV